MVAISKIMKVGVKIWDNEKDIAKAKEIAPYVDFIEVMASNPKFIPLLKEINVPYVIHCMHQEHDVNFANRKKHYANYASLLTAIKFADELNAKFIVVHQGYLEDGNCNIQNVGSFFSKIDDKRILFENLPMNDQIDFIGTRVDDIKKLMQLGGKGLCLDFAHGIMTAEVLKMHPVVYLKGFLDLKPKYFHIANVKQMEDHKHFEEGDFQMELLKNLLPKDAYVCIETSLDVEKLKKEIEFLKR